MSLKRLAVISAVGSHNSFNNQTISYVSSYSGGVGEQGGVVGSAGSSSGNVRTTGGHHQGLHTMRPGANLHGNVNIMLGGAMLSVVVTVVCFVCYCCHRNIKKRSNSLYRQQWLETEANMEIYSVEQCYDPPASSSGGGFFLDSGSSGTGDYQSLPVLTSGAINHSASGHPPFAYHQQHHHPYQYHHLLQQQQQQQQQQHHYAPYPNGPPPSYDTVVAQDELLLAGAGPRRKRHDCAALPADCKSSACTEALLRKASARERFAGGVRSQTPRQRRAETPGVARSNADEDDVTEPFWRSIELEEAERLEAQERAQTPNCGCVAAVGSEGGGSQVPPIYCRNCGYHVHDETDGVQINPSTHAMASSSSGAASPERPLVWLDAMNNEALLVDYDGSGTTAGTSSASGAPVPVHRPAANAINRSIALEHGRNITTLNNNADDDDDDDVDSDMLTMPTTPKTTSTLSSPTTTVQGLDTANNNSAGCPAEPTPAANEAPVHPPSPRSAGPSEARCNGENNNVIIGANTRQDSHLIDIPSQPTNPGEPSSDRRAASVTVEDLTNGNASGEPQPATRRPLDANGLVRLDMSQIIDHTGLPTYEAALKLESSGYV